MLERFHSGNGSFFEATRNAALRTCLSWIQLKSSKACACCWLEYRRSQNSELVILVFARNGVDMKLLKSRSAFFSREQCATQCIASWLWFYLCVSWWSDADCICLGLYSRIKAPASKMDQSFDLDLSQSHASSAQKIVTPNNFSHLLKRDEVCIGVIRVLCNVPGVDSIGLCFVSVILLGVDGWDEVFSWNKLLILTVKLRLS